MISLLLQCALRIQDIVGPTFREIKGVKANALGFRKIHFIAKKTNAREVLIDQETYEIVLAY